MKNIVLIGMPGSGKTTISKALGEKLLLPVIDLDVFLVDHFQMSIADMFNIGEAYFRDRENEVCALVSSKENTIIACGGGVVLRPENITYLKQNGTVFLLSRDLEKIVNDVDVDGRPLLKKGKQELYRLYEQRKNLYLQAADVIIDNNHQIEDTINQIVAYLKRKTIK